MKDEVEKEIERALDKACHDLCNELSPVSITEHLDLDVDCKKVAKNTWAITVVVKEEI
jgi:hypothetical protein